MSTPLGTTNYLKYQECHIASQAMWRWSDFDICHLTYLKLILLFSRLASLFFLPKCSYAFYQVPLSGLLSNWNELTMLNFSVSSPTMSSWLPNPVCYSSLLFLKFVHSFPSLRPWLRSKSHHPSSELLTPILIYSIKTRNDLKYQSHSIFHYCA